MDKSFAAATEKGRTIGETMKHFADRCKEIYVQYTYPTFDKNGKAVSVFNTDGYEEIDKEIEECLKDFLKKVGVNEE